MPRRPPSCVGSDRDNQCIASERSRKRQLMTVWIMHVEVPFFPGSVLSNIRIKSFLFEMSPECIHIRDVKYHSPPTSSCLALLQVDDGELGTWNAQRRETCVRPTIEEFHTQQIAIEPQGTLHINDIQGDSGDPFNFRLQSGSSLSCLVLVEFVF